MNVSVGFQTTRTLGKLLSYIYSTKQGAVFCFCFNIFNSNSGSLTSCGFREWQGLLKVLKTLEVCRNHVTNICGGKELANRIRSSCLVDEANQFTAESKVKSWRLLLGRYFKILCFWSWTSCCRGWQRNISQFSKWKCFASSFANG
jgi:hypothetical protein